MRKTVLLSLSVALLTVAVIACTCNPSPTPTGALTATSTEEPMPASAPANASLGDTWTRPADGMVMVYVPGGTFQMGSDESDSDADNSEFPQHAVTLDSFWIDRTEVSVAQFRQCVTETGYETDAERKGWAYAWTGTEWAEVDGADWQHPQGPNSHAQEDHPVVQASWNDAAAYCEWAKAQLPTEAQWEYAARGPEGYIYPWGDTFDGTRLNFCDANCPRESWRVADYDDGYGLTAPVGSYPGGASWCGARDMTGNVWEWVADWHDSGYFGNSPSQNPTGPEIGAYRMVRGGGWSNDHRDVRAAERSIATPDIRSGDLGFRCVVLPGE